MSLTQWCVYSAYQDSHFFKVFRKSEPLKCFDYLGRFLSFLYNFMCFMLCHTERGSDFNSSRTWCLKIIEPCWATLKVWSCFEKVFLWILFILSTNDILWFLQWNFLLFIETLDWEKRLATCGYFNDLFVKNVNVYYLIKISHIKVHFSVVNKSYLNESFRYIYDFI